jgi:hypothetical protein
LKQLKRIKTENNNKIAKDKYSLGIKRFCNMKMNFIMTIIISLYELILIVDVGLWKG